MKNFLYNSVKIVLIFSLIFNFNVLNVISQSSVQDEQINRQKLQDELAELEKELASVTAQLTTQKGQSASLRNDIAILNSKINQSKLDIKAKNLLIQKLGGEITEKNKTIYSLTEKIEREKESLAQLLRKSYELQDETSFVHVILSGQTISEFYRDLDDFQNIQESINESLDVIRGNKVVIETEKVGLIKKQDEQENAIAKIESAKKTVELSEKEKQSLLKISQGKESEYEKVKTEKEKQRSQILAALFNLRDSNTQINFEQALEYAEQAGKATGVRPALLLAILTQETNLGKNVGTCNRAGDPSSKSYRVIMPGPKDIASGKSRRDDQTIFLKIVSELGRDPETTPLSCPSGGGWGGAMGPSQFIPSTWMSVRDEVADLLNKPLADPWNPRDAFMATALYLKKLGANAQTYTAERNAACRYYSGSACLANRKPPNVFYGNSVMALADKLERDIDIVKRR